MVDFDKLVQDVVNAAHQEGKQEQLGVYPMQPFYNATHKAVDALLDAINTCGVPEGAKHTVTPSVPSVLPPMSGLSGEGEEDR